MMKRFPLSIAPLIALLAPSSLPATARPCRDRDGRITTCAKVRKPSPRCKDASGRFVACAAPHASATPAPDAQ